MKTVYLASMIWSESHEPLLAGTNKKKLHNAAYKMLRTEHGTGPVNRGSAMCHLPIAHDDIEITTIPMMSPHRKKLKKTD